MISIPKQLENQKFILLNRKEKTPINKWGEEKNQINFSSKTLERHLNTGGNYGVVCGFNNLIVVDTDSKFRTIIAKQFLPKTFTVSTTKGAHFYYYIKDDVKQQNLEKLDIKSKGGYVVAPNSIHPSGMVYEVINNNKIETVTLEDVEKFKSLFYFCPKNILELHSALFEYKFFDILINKGSDRQIDNKYFKYCVIHAINEKNLPSSEFNKLATKIANYLEHSPSELFGWIKKNETKKMEWSEGEVIQWLNNIDVNFAGEYKKFLNKLTNTRINIPEVLLPRDGRLNIEFFNDCAEYFKNDDVLFYRWKFDDVVRIIKCYSEFLEKNIQQFSSITSKNFYSIFENKISTYKIGRHEIRIHKSPTEQLLNLFMNSNELKNSLNKIDRFFTSPIMFIKENELQISNIGYNKKLEAFFSHNMDNIEFFPLEKAKEIIDDLIVDFPFKDTVDRTFFYAYLISPACRTLYKNICARSPLFAIMGNRPGVGKDTLANLILTIYEGEVNHQTAISSDKGSDSEEFRKKITSFLKSGRRIFHSANNRVHLANENFEQLLSNEVWSDRILGKNEEIKVNNELEFSLSGNIGMTINQDIKRRSRLIRLAYNEEHIEKRNFKHNPIEQHVLENRELYLSAIFSLIKYWFDDGQKPGKNFSGFSEWGRVVGGVCESCGIGDPTIVQDIDEFEDPRTKSMKVLFDRMKNEEYQNGVVMKEIGEVVCELQQDGYFAFLDSEGDSLTRSGKSKLGLLIKEFLGRIFDGVELRIFENSKNAGRVKYVFLEI